MSNVTNLILTTSSGEKRKEVSLQLEKFVHNGGAFKIVSIEDSALPKGWYGGTKYLECNVFIGAYNNLDLDLFIQFLKKVKWQEPEGIQLIVRGQFDFKFRIIDLF